MPDQPLGDLYFQKLENLVLHCLVIAEVKYRIWDTVDGGNALTERYE